MDRAEVTLAMVLTAVRSRLAGEAGWEREAPADGAEYRPFPDVSRRNAWQEVVEVPAMVRALRLPKGRRVLEVGCGRGIALPPLARLLRPTRLVGLDVDRALLRQAEARIRRRRVTADLLQGDARALPFPDAAFDVVIDFGTCYHVARPQHALAEVERVLAAGGLFVHETRASQLLSHPARARGRRLPWQVVPALRPHCHRVLWASRAKSDRASAGALPAYFLSEVFPAPEPGSLAPPSLAPALLSLPPSPDAPLSLPLSPPEDLRA